MKSLNPGDRSVQVEMKRYLQKKETFNKALDSVQFQGRRSAAGGLITGAPKEVPLRYAPHEVTLG